MLDARLSTKMLLHLIRHGHALPADEDSSRPLSPRGRAAVTRLAEFLRTSEVGPPRFVWHSPLRRARETVALLAQHAGRPMTLIEKSYLQPDDDPEKILRLLAEMPPPADLAIVGHQPHLGTLATLLATGRAYPAAFAFETAGLLTLASTTEKHERNGLPRWKPRSEWAPPLT